MVDARHVRRLLQRIEDDLAFLRERAGGDRAALRADRERVAALKYVFVTAIEGCIDARAVGFRNVLVRGYADVNDDLVVAQLDRVEDLAAFVAAVARFAA